PEPRWARRGSDTGAREAYKSGHLKKGFEFCASRRLSCRLAQGGGVFPRGYAGPFFSPSLQPFDGMRSLPRVPLAQLADWEEVIIRGHSTEWLVIAASRHQESKAD